MRLIRTKIGSIDLVQLGLQPGETKEIEPLLYPDFKDVPAAEPYRSRSYVKKPGGTGGKPIHQRKIKMALPKKKSGTPRIWQMEESEKPRRKTNGTHALIPKPWTSGTLNKKGISSLIMVGSIPLF